MTGGRVSRRELLAAGAAAGAALGLPGTGFAGSPATWRRASDFGALASGTGWPGWACPGVANLRRSDGLGLLEAGSDVFPCDPRPVAFALDQRFRDGEVEAIIESAGAGAGVVLRRTGPRDYYAAVYDDEQRALVILRRSPAGVVELGRAPATATAPLHLSFSASGSRPTALVATIEGISVTARDAAAPLQRAGDPGVLATARTVFPSDRPPVVPALGNLHLLPYGVQEGQAVIASPAGAELIGTIRERSTAAFERIEVRPSDATTPTRPSVGAGPASPLAGGGAALHVATDVPARVDLEISSHADFRDSRHVRAGRTDRFESAVADIAGMRPGHPVHWRARPRPGRPGAGRPPPRLPP